MMHDEHLKRIRQDLETVEQAVGLKPTFYPSEIWLNFACIPTGLLAVAWALLMPHALPQWGLLPTLLLCIGYSFLTSRKGPQEVSEKDRRQLYILMMVAIGLALLFLFWAVKQHLSRTLIFSVTTMAIGALLVTLSVSHPRRLYQLGGGIPFLVAGFVMPFWNVPWTVPMGLAIATAGGLLATIQLIQLRSIPSSPQIRS